MSREKQIDEMAKVIDEITEPLSARDIHKAEFSEQFAERLYNAGYSKQSEWISVDERLPDKGQEVLAYRGDFNGDMMNTYTYLGSGNWEDDYGYRGSTEHEGITHWMPLPEPPKEKENTET